MKNLSLFSFGAFSKPALVSLALITLSLFSNNLLAANKSIMLAELGKYNLAFEQVSLVKKVAGNRVLAKVTEKVGSNFSMFLPFSVQKIKFLVANGEYVKKNQGIAILTGYDVHHFLDEYQAAEQLFYIAEKHYQASLKLVNNKAINQARWIEVSKRYFDAKLQLGHLEHFKSFLTISPNEQVTINAPVNGVLRYDNTEIAKQEGQLLFDVIPNAAMRLKANVAIKNIENLIEFKLNSGECHLKVDTTEQKVNHFAVTVWTQAVTSSCQLMLGEQTVVIPIYQQAAFSVNKQAVFEFEDQNYLVIKDGQQLSLVTIDIISSTPTHYLVSSEKSLENQEVLISSVSAVQGVLLELGGE